MLRQFETVFSERVWERTKVLLIGAILTPRGRTVAAILRVMGCADEKQFQNYHRVLNRAKWSSRELSRRLLMVLVKLFMRADVPIVIGIPRDAQRGAGKEAEKKRLLVEEGYSGELEQIRVFHQPVR